MKYPESMKDNVQDTYHGIPVVDEYRWLENPENPAVKTWIDVQNRFMRQTLDAFPGRQETYEQLKMLYTATSADYFSISIVAGIIFAIKFQPPKQQPMLISLTDPYDLSTEKIILDPNELDPSGNTAIDFYRASLDGSKIAVSLSKHGSEDGTLYIYTSDSCTELGDVVPRVNFPTGGGSAVWNADGSGLYYTRYPAPGERPEEDLHFFQQVWYHQLGTDTSKDTYVIGEDFPRIAEISLDSTKDGAYILALVRNGDGGEMNHYLSGLDGTWKQLTQFSDKIQDYVFGPYGVLYFLSRQEALRGKIIRMPLDNPNLENAETIIPERKTAIEAFEVTSKYIYLLEMDGGPSRLSMFDHEGNEIKQVPIETISSVWEIASWRGDEILYRSASFITPPAWYHYDPASDISQKTSLCVSSSADFSDCEVLREYAVSRDGTRVPINIIKRRGTNLDGRNPTLLSGYGGYGICVKPFFQVRRRVWLDRGGIIVVANLRGGGEYGDAWHLAGNLTNKQNVFDDFIGCARHLIARSYTSPQKLCIEGGSNGGLLMGAALTQQPELFKAVAAHVGIYDMLRVELDPNGAFNITEFGTVHNPQHFEAIYDYSPYHKVQNATKYPAVLLTTGEHDGRVNPAQSRKMAARLQEATGSDLPVLLRTSSAGHGIGTSLDERIALDADVFTFLNQMVSE